MYNFLLKNIKIHIIIGFIACVIISYSGYMVHINFNKNHQTILRIEEIVNNITYYDEVLTMSARMASFTGYPSWENRYRIYEGKLDAILKEAYSLFPQSTVDILTKETTDSNNKLIEMENNAFLLVKAGKSIEAQKILFSDQYNDQKMIYSLGQKNLEEALKKYEIELDTQHLKITLLIISTSCLCILLLSISIFLNYKTMHRAYTQEKIASDYKRLANVGRVSAGMAHEINNALQPIMGLSEILYKSLSKKGTEFSQLSEYSKIIYDSAHHSREIIENVLTSAKGTQSQLEKWGAYELFSSAFDLASQILPESTILKTNFSIIVADKNKYQVLANKTNVTQMISNILKNAAHAMNDNGTINVAVDLITLDEDAAKIHDVSQGQYLSLNIEDTGCGMDSKTLSNLFSPFFTTKSDQGGTGLGLSVSYGIMKQMGGDIKVVSKLKKGTNFTLFFPLQT